MKKQTLVFLYCLLSSLLIFFIRCDIESKENRSNPSVETQDQSEIIKKLKIEIDKRDKLLKESSKRLEQEKLIFVILSFICLIFSIIIYIMYKIEKNKNRKNLINSSKITGIAFPPNNLNRGISIRPGSGIIPLSLQDKTNPKWIVTGASVIGKSHIKNNLPCQDKHQITKLEAGWGVAITCDGAGSAKKSDLGAEFVSKNASEVFTHLIKKQEWIKQRKLPDSKEWAKLSIEALQVVRHQLDAYAHKKEIIINDLACTIIVLVYSPYGMLTTHIGDGRAGYCTKSDEWLPLITPWKGDEANQTVFITSAIWNNPENFIESRVTLDVPKAFTLMSDGCESHSFELGYFDDDKQKYIDKNKPYPKFFNPLVEQLQKLYSNGVPEKDIQIIWEKFLIDGSKGLIDEPDDKTMILGIMLNKNL